MEEQKSITVNSFASQSESGEETIRNRETDFAFKPNYWDRFFTKPLTNQICFEWFHSVRRNIKSSIKKVYGSFKKKIKKALKVEIVNPFQLSIIF